MVQIGQEPLSHADLHDQTEPVTGKLMMPFPVSAKCPSIPAPASSIGKENAFEAKLNWMKL